MTNDQLVGTAKVRAAILAFLHNNPGNHFVSEVAAQVGVSGISAGQLLSNMKKANMVDGTRINGKLVYFDMDPSKKDAQSEAATMLPTLAKTKALKPMPQPVPQQQRGEVEFVVGGVVIVMGRNTENGRLRITFDAA